MDHNYDNLPDEGKPPKKEKPLKILQPTRVYTEVGNNNDGDQKSKIVYFYYVFVYALAIMLNGNTYSLVNDQLQKTLISDKISLNYYNALQYLPIVNLGAMFISIFLIEKLGFKWTSIFAVLVQTISLWLNRYLETTFNSSISYLFVLVFTQPLLINGLLTISQTFFGNHRLRQLSTGLILILGVQGTNTFQQLHYKNTYPPIDDFELTVCIMNSIVCLLFLTFMMPKVPLSKSQAHYEENKFEYGNEIRAALQDNVFLKITLANVILIAILKSLATTYNSIYQSPKDSESFTEWNSLCFSFVNPYATIIGILLFWLLASYKSHIKLLTVFLITLHTWLLVFIIVILAADIYNFYIEFNAVFSLLIGCSILAITDLQAEVTFPLRLSFGYAVFNTGVYFANFFISQYMSYFNATYVFLDKQVEAGVPLIGVLSIFLMLITLLMFTLSDTKLKRRAYEEGGQL